jgi:hypothetical protein
VVVDATQIPHLDLAIEFLFALTHHRFVKRFAWIDGPSRQAPPSIPISGLQEQHASGLVGDDRMCAQSVPVVESHLEPNLGLKTLANEADLRFALTRGRPATISGRLVQRGVRARYI